MLNTTITLALDGDVPLDLFAKALRHWQGLIAGLSGEVSGDADIRWIIEGVHEGSTAVTVRGEAHDLSAVERVVRAYDVVGKALERGGELPFSEDIERDAREIAGLVDGRIAAVRLETANAGWIVVGEVSGGPRRMLQSIGRVEGTLQALISRDGLRCVVVDSLFRVPVTCYLDEGHEELVRDAWNRRAIVEGLVSREPVSGRPVAVRNVTDVSLPPEVPPGSYRAARGVAPPLPGSELPEETIRRLRDA